MIRVSAKIPIVKLSRNLPEVTPKFFKKASDFRAWLDLNHATKNELLVGFCKVGSGKPSMTWSESVDEALCFGWIDGVRKRIDDESYSIRFTPRRVGSIWSRVNIAKVEQLIAQNRMRPAGLAAFEARSSKKTGVYSFEQEHKIELSDSELIEFQRNKAAWRFFDTTPPSYKKTIIYWIVSAKRPATRTRRLEELIQACSEHRRLLK